MYQTKIRYDILLMLLVLYGCIEPYKPLLKSDESKQYVISGQITDIEGYQYVSVSFASPVNDPEFIPVENCDIKIYGTNDATFSFEEYDPGNYRVWMEKAYLAPGIAYRLAVTTPSGVSIISEFDTMTVCPPIDTVYYEREDILTNDPALPREGIQFYVDLDAKGAGSNHYMWEIFETWEYHTEYPIEWYYDGEFHQFSPPDYSKKVCWLTKRISDIFTISLVDLNQRTYKKFPFHFVDNKTSRLEYCYSILVNQYALSEAAYIYWDQMRENSTPEESLYDKQPISIIGNLKSDSNPEIEILGFFYVASVKSKRIFVKNVKDLVLDYYTFCPQPENLDRGGWGAYLPSEYPIYFYIVQNSPKIISWSCVDCLIFGGTNVKPDYWPDLK